MLCHLIKCSPMLPMMPHKYKHTMLDLFSPPQRGPGVLQTHIHTPTWTMSLYMPRMDKTRRSINNKGHIFIHPSCLLFTPGFHWVIPLARRGVSATGNWKARQLDWSCRRKQTKVAKLQLPWSEGARGSQFQSIVILLTQYQKIHASSSICIYFFNLYLKRLFK